MFVTKTEKGTFIMKLSEVKNAETFKIGDVEFIKFGEENGRVTAVTKDIQFFSCFGETNNLSKSEIIETLEKDFLPKIAEQVGEENIIDFETDLLTIDGLTDYGTMTSKVSLPTVDFYRKNRDIFEKYTIKKRFWLATANGNNCFVLRVSPLGYVDNDYYFNGSGVRPLCIFSSSIFVSK